MLSEYYLYLIIIYIVSIFSAYIFGVKKGVLRGEKSKRNAEKKLNIILTNLRSQNSRLQKENKNLNNKLSKYLKFFVNIPEAVKNVNSHLSFDDIITSIVRMVKQLIETDIIELYMYDESKDCIKLIAAHGSKRGSSIEVKLREGVVGCAAETKMIFSKAQLGLYNGESDTDIIETAAPIFFRDELLGVIGIGEIMLKSENDKRFLSMIADLAAVAFNNCKNLDTAKDEASRDALTGLYNKRYFLERGIEAIRNAAKYDFIFSIFIFDIDNFKHYNDTNGHVQGDLLLKKLSSLIKENTHSSNIVARYGGEEFIILLQNSDKSCAMEYAEMLRGLLEAHSFPAGDKQPLGYISISGGVAAFPDDGKSIDELIKHADEALYKSKEWGRNRITEYRSDQYLSEEIISE